LGLGAVHTARNGNVASIHRDSLGVRVSVEAPSGLRYTFMHNQAYGVGSLMAWVGGVVIRVRVDDRFGHAALSSDRVPGNVAGLPVALLIIHIPWLR